MDTEKILQELDRLFAAYQMDKAEIFLKEKIEEAASNEDSETLLTLLNEMIGYLRDLGKFEKCYEYCNQAAFLMEQMGLRGTVPYATTLLNIANAYRAGGRPEESMVLYQSVLNIYKKELTENDFRFASFYNNLSLLYQEMDDFEQACVCLKKALEIAEKHADARIETAVTHTNLAASLLKLGNWQEAMGHLQKAFSIFDMDEQKDFHYSGALSAMGEAQYLAGNLEESAKYYSLALKEIEKNTGKSKSYEITLQNLNAVKMQMDKHPSVVLHYEKGLELCEAFYEEYGKPMLWDKFPQYVPYLATGLVGEGSECFGFDDEISRDHDFGPGFCIWLSDPVYEEIGEQMQLEYDRLPRTYMGITRRQSPKAPKRVGVFRISDFYESLIGTKEAPAFQNQWLFVDDYRLAAATNGKVFYDGLGEFSRIRKQLLKYYPEEVRVKKVAHEAALMAQSGQYNYGRMYGRGEIVTAQIALSEFMQHTMSMVYLLNRKYAPYYKWMHKGMENLSVLKIIREILQNLAQMQIGDDRIPETIEAIVTLIIAEMKKQSLTTGDDTYLDHHTDKILMSIGVSDTEKTTVKEKLINKLVLLEWHDFDQVKNEGGRADCQDDWNTFSIMRKSQYLTWTIPMLQSYCRDFEEADAKGWNLITEKYGRMMESTDPDGYKRIENRLPKLPEEKKEIIEEIVKIQMDFMEECAAKYKKAAGLMRSLHSSEDNLWNTSYETYLRGELSTYSDTTIDLYGRFIAKLCTERKNLAIMILQNSAKLYGYSSLDALENKLQ